MERVRKRFVEEGFEAALSERARDPVPSASSTATRRRICGSPGLLRPTAGQKAQWTMRLLADELVESEVVESISDEETVRRTLKRGL